MLNLFPEQRWTQDWNSLNTCHTERIILKFPTHPAPIRRAIQPLSKRLQPSTPVVFLRPITQSKSSSVRLHLKLHGADINPYATDTSRPTLAALSLQITGHTCQTHDMLNVHCHSSCKTGFLNISGFYISRPIMPNNYVNTHGCKKWLLSGGGEFWFLWHVLAKAAVVVQFGAGTHLQKYHGSGLDDLIRSVPPGKTKSSHTSNIRLRWSFDANGKD